MSEQGKKLIAECVATFFLVFFGTAAIVVDQTYHGVVGHIGVSIVFGLIVTIMIYSFGSVSGAHMNPAVSIALFVIKRIELKTCLSYIAMQVLGALIASLAIKSMFPANATLGATLPLGGYWQSAVLEFVMSFLLMLVILRVAVRTHTSVQLVGAIVGSVVLLEALMGGPISGASMNPARSLGPAVLAANIQGLEIYLLAPTLGMIFAAKLEELLFGHHA